MTATPTAKASWTARTRGPAFLLMAVGGLAAIIIGGRPWYQVPGIDVSFSGKDVTGGLAQALPVVVLAGALLMLTVRTLGRRIVGIVVGLVAIAMTAIGLFPSAPGSGEVVSKVRQQTLTKVGNVQPQAWNWGYAAAGLLVLAGALLMVLYAHRWPRRADRFTRNQTVPTATPGTEKPGSSHRGASPDTAAGSTNPATPEGADLDPEEIWKAMDAGRDPTDPGPEDDAWDDAGTANVAGQDDTGGTSVAGSRDDDDGAGF